MKFAEKIAKFADSRLPWAILVAVSAGLVILAHSLFQNYVYMPPCEQCVYIRFAFLCMALGGLVAIVNPKNLLLALVGYLLAFWGAVQGIMYSVKLAKIHDAVHGDDPFGLPLERWAPDWFLPTGDCGYDNPLVPEGVTLDGFQKYLVDLYGDGWYLIPSSKFMSMADCTLVGFSVCFVVLAAMFICKILTLKKA